jgi:hypothetical protein
MATTANTSPMSNPRTSSPIQITIFSAYRHPSELQQLKSATAVGLASQETHSPLQPLALPFGVFGH